ncbi:MAG TPA: cytochrome P450 [Bryobacteraceae bacterium]|nr:cytochrome P450 [Bryobacteraceae bacterium]
MIRVLQVILGQRLRMMEQVGAEIPRIGRVDFGRFQMVLVNAPELVPEVLIERADDFTKGWVLRVIARPVFGDGLLTSEGDLHRQRRRLVAPALAHQRMGHYADVMREHTERMASTWRDGQKLDIVDAMMHLTLGIVCRTLFDVDVPGEADAIGRDITAAQTYATRKMRYPFPLPQRRPLAALARLNERIYGIIHERRARLEDRGDLLSMLLLARDEETDAGLDDKAVRDEAMTLFLAGHETTALATGYAWHLLARHPHYFARLREEGAPFALQVMKESMRLYPPAYSIARTAARDTAIGGFPIREGETVVIAQWLLHRDPRFFEDPMRFDPDRFRPEREAQIPRNAYLPFGGGRRICIGNHFALMEGQIILEAIARCFTMEPASSRPLRFEPMITLRPKGGVPVILRRV